MKNISLIIVLLFICSCKSPVEERVPLVTAPFSNLDTLATNDWWNRASNPIVDLKVARDSVVAFGIYTVANKTLKLSAQLYPLYPEEPRELRLLIYEDNNWKDVQKARINDLGWSALFRIDDWDKNTDVKYQIRHGENAFFEGTIRKDPTDKNEIVLAALSCNSNKDRGMRKNYVRNINHQDPDLISSQEINLMTTQNTRPHG